MKLKSFFLLLFIWPGNWAQTSQNSYENGDYQSSLQILKENESLESGINLFNQAQNLRRLDSIPASILMYEKSLSLLDAKEKSVSLNNLAVLLSKKGNLNDALEKLKQALREDPNNAFALRNYEILYKKPKKNPPPPKPNFVNPPPQANQKNADSLEVNIPDITENEADAYLIELQNRPLKYIQQLKKIVKAKPNGPH